MNQYFYDWNKRIKITQRDARHIQDENTFSKVLEQFSIGDSIGDSSGLSIEVLIVQI